MMKANTGNHTAARPEILAQYILGFLLTNGLARVGGQYQLQGSPRLTPGANDTVDLDGTYWVSGKGDFFTVDPDASKNWVKLRVDSTIQGYAYNTRGAGTKVAIAFLLSYCTLALAYTVYTGFSGISSTVWDSIAEVTALAMNSVPTRNLQNTCGGISELRTFKTPVRVLVRSDDGDGEGEHLELVFGDDAEERSVQERGTIKANRAYGTLPSSYIEK